MTNKTIIISHGEKGGCGKSLITNIVGSYLFKEGHNFALIDADASQSTSRADIYDRKGNRFWLCLRNRSNAWR